MSKLQLAGASLIAAVPSFILAGLLVMGFLNHSGQMKPLLQALAGITLLPAVVASLLPIAAFLFLGPKPGDAATTVPDEFVDEDMVDEEGMELADDDEMGSRFSADDDDEGSSVDMDDEGILDVDDEGSTEQEFSVDDDDDSLHTTDFEAVMDDDLDQGDEFDLGGGDDDDFLADLDDEEDEKPKKKKKK